MGSLPRHRALSLLHECSGRDIWPVDYCLQRGVPGKWIELLADNFESGFENDRETIYYRGSPTNQFRGIRDADLALQIARELGIDLSRIQHLAASPETLVREIIEAVEEG